MQIKMDDEGVFEKKDREKGNERSLPPTWKEQGLKMPFKEIATLFNVHLEKSSSFLIIMLSTLSFHL